MIMKEIQCALCVGAIFLNTSFDVKLKKRGKGERETSLDWMVNSKCYREYDPTFPELFISRDAPHIIKWGVFFIYLQ